MCGDKISIAQRIMVCSLDPWNSTRCENKVKIRRIEVIDLLPAITVADKGIKPTCAAHLSKIKAHPWRKSRLNRKDLTKNLTL